MVRSHTTSGTSTAVVVGEVGGETGRVGGLVAGSRSPRGWCAANSSTRAGASTRFDTSRTWLSQPPTRRSAARSIVDDRVDARPLHLDARRRRAPCRPRRRRPSVARCACPSDAAAMGDSVDRREHPSRGMPSSASASARMRVERHGRDLVLQPLELFRDLGRQHVEARRQVLADLDHQAAEVERERVEPPGETLHARGPGCARRPAQADARQHELEPPRHARDAARRTAGCGGSARDRPGHSPPADWSGIGRRHPRQSCARIE